MGSKIGCQLGVYYTQFCGGQIVRCVPRWIVGEVWRGGEGQGDRVYFADRMDANHAVELLLVDQPKGDGGTMAPTKCLASG